VVFVAVAIASGIFYMVKARHLWFADDEWDFLAARSATSVHDLFRAHYGHWSTIPILVYRVLWQFVGVRSYLPYVVIAVVLHLTVAALLWVVMCRAMVNPWVATAGASLYALFGTGAQDILWAFQIGYKGALALGLLQLVLADHDGPLDRRDLFALVAGLGALMCSAIGIVMVGVVGLAMLVRRGVRVALVHVVPLAVIYATWWAVTGRNGTEHGALTVSIVERWLREGFTGTVSALTKGAGVAPLLVVAVVAGIVLSFATSDPTRRRQRLGVPAALLAGAAGYLIVAAYARTNTFFGNPRAGRYVDIVAAMALPAIAVGVDEVTRRWRYAAAVAVALLVVGIPANIGALNDYANARAVTDRQTRRLVTTLPRVPVAREVPRAVKPVHEFPEHFVTIGWLLDAARAGRVPRPGPLTPADIRTATFRLSFLQSSANVPLRQCHTVVDPEIISLRRGESIGIKGWPFDMTSVAPTGESVALSFDPRTGNQLTAVASPLRVRVASRSPFFAVALCHVGS
jgi:hypothetical protein